MSSLFLIIIEGKKKSGRVGGAAPRSEPFELLGRKKSNNKHQEKNARTTAVVSGLTRELISFTGPAEAPSPESQLQLALN